MKKIASVVGLTAGALLIASLPLVTFAQSDVGSAGSGIIGQASEITQSAQGLAGDVNGLLNIIIGVLITLAVVVFIFNVIRFILSKNEEDKKSARSYLLWSIIAIAVILGIFGIAKLILGTVGIDGNNLQQSDIPTVPTASSNGGY
jgi:hypothetical protein